MNYFLGFSFVAFFMGVGSAQAAQVCYSSIENTNGRHLTAMHVRSDGTAQDSHTRLVWSLCLLGQTWQPTTRTCSGMPVQLSWSDALLQSSQATVASHRNWRLPNVKEVQTIINRSCVDPALTLEVFPNSNSENIWTSTTVVNQPQSAFAVAMYSGKNNIKTKNTPLYVRLVRFEDQ